MAGLIITAVTAIVAIVMTDRERLDKLEYSQGEKVEAGELARHESDDLPLNPPTQFLPVDSMVLRVHSGCVRSQRFFRWFWH